MRIHGGKKKKHRPSLPSRITLGTYDTKKYPWVKRTDFGIAVTLPKDQDPTRPENPGEPEESEDPDDDEVVEDPNDPEGPEDPNPPREEPEPDQSSTPGNTEPVDVPDEGGTIIPDAGNTDPNSTTPATPSGTSTGDVNQVGPGDGTNPAGI